MGEYSNLNDIAKFDYSKNNSEPLRDLACMIDLEYYSEYINYHVEDCNDRIIVEFNYNTKYERTFARFNGDGIVDLFALVDGEVKRITAFDSHSCIGSSSIQVKSKFANIVKDALGAIIHVMNTDQSLFRSTKQSGNKNIEHISNSIHTTATDWIDNADSWICPNCKNEVANPFYFSSTATCKRCGFTPDKFKKENKVSYT